MHALTIRLPEKTYLAARQLADRDGISLNRFVQEAIAQKAQEAIEVRMREAYELLADDTEESDIESLLAVQAEALLHD